MKYLLTFLVLSFIFISANSSQAQIILESPNGGEQLYAGEMKYIYWHAYGVTNVKVAYTTNNDSDWIEIVNSTPAISPGHTTDGGYEWTVPNTVSSNCKVRISDVENSATNDESANVFGIFSLPNLTLIQPIGGEVWQVGSNQQIRYSVMGVVSDATLPIHVEYTTDNGSNWLPTSLDSEIPPEDSPDEYINWNGIPNTPSTNCKVRLVTDNNQVLATSANVFSIALPLPLVLVNPNGGERLYSGENKTIYWQAFGVTNVRIEYTTNNGSDWIEVIGSTPAITPGQSYTGEYQWTIPNTISNNCKVRISDVANSATNDESGNVFGIFSLPTLTLIQPIGGEIWQVGSNQQIRYSVAGVISDADLLIHVEYTTDNGSNWLPTSLDSGIPPEDSPDEYINWNALPNTPSTNCKVRIVTDNDQVLTTSPNTFTIGSGSTNPLTLITPNGGESWVVGSTHLVQWESTYEGLITIELAYSTDNGENYTTFEVRLASPNDEYEWTIPNILSSNCKVRVLNPEYPSEYDISDAVFSIVAPLSNQIRLVSPNGGESWVAGSTHTISWTFDGDGPSDDPDEDGILGEDDNCPFTYNPGQEDLDGDGIGDACEDHTVTIEYSPWGEELWQPIVSSTPAETGSYLWLIPNRPESAMKVRISETNNPSNSDGSNAPFAIICVPPSPITLLSPNGSEIWQVGSVHTIMWDRDEEIIAVEISYSIDGGENYLIIESIFPFETEYDWTIPNTVSDNCMIRIRHPLNNSQFDVNDAVFSIVETLPVNQLTLISPNGEESWTVGSSHAITWMLPIPEGGDEEDYDGDGVANENDNCPFTSNPGQEDEDEDGMGDVCESKNLQLAYSINGGGNWITIAENASAELLRYNWLIPNTISEECLVGVADASNPLINDVSDNNFSIVASQSSQLTLESPNGGESWMVGSSHAITWMLPIPEGSDEEDYDGDGVANENDNCPFTSNPDQNDDDEDGIGDACEENNVDLEYSNDGGGEWVTIANSINTEQLTYSWIIPNNPSEDCLVRISEVGNPTNFDVSDDMFSIVQGSISHFTKVWDRPYMPMNIYVTLATVDGVNLQAGSEIAVYDGSICVGVSALSGPITPGEYLSIIVSGDDPTTPNVDGFTTGNSIRYKFWDAEQSLMISRVNANYIQGEGIFNLLETATVELSGICNITHNIELTEGWNIFSLMGAPIDQDMLDLLNTLSTENKLIKVQDETGNAVVKLPAPINWINSIGSWLETEGYFIKVNVNCTLSATGPAVGLPISVPINAGWNLISYPVVGEQNAQDALQPMITANQLIKLQDETGNAIVNLPGIGWVNHIGSLKSGEGYYLKSSENTQLILDEPVAAPLPKISGKNIAAPQKIAANHFVPIYSGYPFQAMNIYVKQADLFGGQSLSVGDEIGIFDGNLCVGAAIVTDQITPIAPLSMLAGANDITTTPIDGFVAGHQIAYRFWLAGSSQEINQYTASYTFGEGLSQGIFEPSGTALVSFTNILPVELVSFSASALSNNVVLTWSTATEINNYGFEIERKSSSDWVKLGFIQGSGNSNSPQNYEFIDKNPIGGSKFMYRLLQIDSDGTYEYSEIIEVELLPKTFELSQNYPNPFNPTTKIRFSVPNSSELRIELFNMVGEKMKTLAEGKYEIGTYEIDIDMRNLPSGIYLYKLQSKEFVKVRKLLLMK